MGKIKIVLLVVLILIVGFFALDHLNLTGNWMRGIHRSRPILNVDNVLTEIEKQGSECYSVVSGFISNKGDVGRRSVVVTCKAAIYPMTDYSGEISEEIGFLKRGGEKDFEIRAKVNCEDAPRFECSVDCYWC